MRDIINITGTNQLTSKESEKFYKISGRNLKKMQKKLHGVTGMNIKIKTYNPEGSRKKFSIISSMNLGSRKFEAGSEDWKIFRALKNSLRSLSNEIEHSLHLSKKSHVRKNK